MTTFQKIKHKAQIVIAAINNYEYFSINHREEDYTNQLRTEAARQIAELAQMISNAAKVTETITETE